MNGGVGDMLYILLFGLLAASFLLGMTWMRIGLFNLSGGAMESNLRKMTGTPLKGMLTGIAMTVVLQSSSAVTVIAVGLVSARILSFPQTVGIILGTNIGTTVTLEFLAFDLSALIIPLLVIGALLLLFRKARVRSWGFILLGIGIIFASMEGFGRLARPLESVGYVQEMLLMMKEQPLAALGLGVVLTALIQSSTVMTGIAMSFIGAGALSLETGIAIMLGANIGTCATALLAGIGAGAEARLVAYSHMWLNVGGALLFYPFMPMLADWSGAMGGDPDSQLAHASVLYNIACSAIVLPFAVQFGSWIVRLHGRKIS